MKRIGFIDGRRVAGWSFPATLTPGQGQLVDVTDPSVGAVAQVAAQTLRYRPRGNKTGINYSMAKYIEVYPYGDTYVLNALALYYATPGRASVIHQYFAQDIYMDPIGAAAVISEMAGISIGMNYTNPAVAVNSAMLRLYVHGAVPMPSAIRIAGSGVTNLFFFQRSVTPILTGAVGGNQNRKIRVRLADIAADYFIPLHTT